MPVQSQGHPFLPHLFLKSLDPRFFLQRQPQLQFLTSLHRNRRLANALLSLRLHAMGLHRQKRRPIQESAQELLLLIKKGLTTGPGELGVALTAVEGPATDGSAVPSGGTWPSVLAYRIAQFTV